tara:strand:+ start:6 stop:716 length:711 start_codon:yes stop_codon:yes gene_type:complete
MITDKCIVINTDDIENFYSYNITDNIIFSILMIISLITTYFGYKIIKPIIFSSGLIVGGGISYLSTEYIMYQVGSFNCLVLYIITVLTSILCGMFSLYAYNLANFLIGFMCGGSFGYFIYNMFLQNYHLGMFLMYDGVQLLSMSIPAISFGIITYVKKRNIALLFTSLSSPILFLTSLEHLIFKHNKYIDFKNNEWKYIYISLYFILCLTGLYTQYFFFQKKKKEEENMSYLPMTK